MRSLPAACLLLSACICSAQDQNQPTIKVTTRLVQVNVVVHDKKGEPVRDLKKEDFTIFDRGKEQKIAVFSVDSIDVPSRAWPALPPDLFSNRLVRPGMPTSINVILLDGLNTKFEDQAYSRRQIIKFLATIEPQDRVALYLLGRDLKILHDFTNDPDHLLKALAKYRGRISAELDAADPAPIEPSGNDDLDQFLNDASQTMSDFYNVNRAKWTLDAMEAIAHHLSSLPGRKNLIWVSGGFPFTLGLEPEDYASNNPNRERRTFHEETERVARAMNDANMAIYPVDARGLIALPQMSAAIKSVPNPARGGMAPSIKMPRNLDTMDILAERTGGRAFYNTNDLQKAVRTAVDDGKVTYTLGFYPPSEDWDGKFHDLKVKVGRGGVDVRFRKGFLAFTEHSPTDKEIHAELQNAIISPLEATGIAINVRSDPTDKPKPGSLNLIVQVASADISIQQQNDRWAGVVDIGFIQYAADGRVLNADTKTITMNLTQPRYDDIKKRGMLMGRVIEPVEKADHLRVVVLDHATGNVGTLSLPMSGSRK